jgi:hypothetical protein
MENLCAVPSVWCVDICLTSVDQLLNDRCTPLHHSHGQWGEAIFSLREVYLDIRTL